MTENIDINLLNKISDNYKTGKNKINELKAFFYSTVKPEIKKNYLSHLISSVIDIVNEVKRVEVIDGIKKGKNDYPEEYLTTLNNAIKSKQLRLFSISLKPIQSLPRFAITKIIKGVAFIYYDDRLDEKQKRLYISHEIGHILIKYLLDNKYENNEKNASIIGLIAMIDKNNFYLNDSKSFSYKSNVELVNEYLNLMK